MLKDQFITVLKNFGEMLDEEFSLDEATNTVSFTVDDDIVINLTYLDDSDTVVIFTPVGGFGETTTLEAKAKALALLKLQDLADIAGNVTLMLDEEANLILAADRCRAITLSSVNELSSWIEILIKAVRSTRNYFAVNFPREEE